MTNYTELQMLYSEVGTLKSLIQGLPEDCVIERDGLEHRLKQVEEKISSLEAIRVKIKEVDINMPSDELNTAVALEVMLWEESSRGTRWESNYQGIFEGSFAKPHWNPSTDPADAVRVMKYMVQRGFELDISSTVYFGPDGEGERQDGWLVTFYKPGGNAGDIVDLSFTKAVCIAALKCVRSNV